MKGITPLSKGAISDIYHLKESVSPVVVQVIAIKKLKNARYR